MNRGLAGGGLTYGYAAIPGKSGERTIVDAEAQVVRRIFQDYVDGRTPREIAHALNKDRVPARVVVRGMRQQSMARGRDVLAFFKTNFMSAVSSGTR